MTADDFGFILVIYALVALIFAPVALASWLLGFFDDSGARR